MRGDAWWASPAPSLRRMLVSDPSSINSVTRNGASSKVVPAPMNCTTCACRTVRSIDASRSISCRSSSADADTPVSTFTATAMSRQVPRHTWPIAPFPMHSPTSSSRQSISQSFCRVLIASVLSTSLSVRYEFDLRMCRQMYQPAATSTANPISTGGSTLASTTPPRDT